ncbi:hypothetical protein SRHO_G00178970 [Serrasalmus rhombeus]
MLNILQAAVMRSLRTAPPLPLVFLLMTAVSLPLLYSSSVQNADPKAQDDTYTALQPSARSSDDVYHTLAAVQSSSPDDPYAALDPRSRSPEYDTLAVSSAR